VCLEDARSIRAHLYVNTHDRLAEVAGRVEAGIAQFQAKLVFAFRVEAAVTFITGRVIWTLLQFADMNFGMDFERDHFNSPRRVGQAGCQTWPLFGTEYIELTERRRRFLCELAQASGRISQWSPYWFERRTPDKHLTQLANWDKTEAYGMLLLVVEGRSSAE